MADRESIKTKVWDENVGVLNSAKNEIDAQAEQERLKQRQEAETEINKVNGKAKQEVDSLYKDYDMAEKLGAVQKLLNERYIRRKMAEWGLSSSGTLNGNLKRAEHLSQKASTLNREVFNKGKLGVTDWKTGQIAKIEKVRDGNIGVIDKNAADLKKQADDDFNKWVNTETDRQYAYAVEEENKQLRKAQNDWNELIGNLNNSKIGVEEKITNISEYVLDYGLTKNVIDIAKSSGFFFADGRVWSETDFSFSKGHNKKEAIGALARIFHSNKYDNDYKKAAFALFFDIYGMPSNEIINGLLYVSNMTHAELIGGI